MQALEDGLVAPTGGVRRPLKGQEQNHLAGNVTFWDPQPSELAELVSSSFNCTEQAERPRKHRGCSF